MNRAQLQKQIQLFTPRIRLVDVLFTAISPVIADVLATCLALSRNRHVIRTRLGATMAKFFWGINWLAPELIDWIVQI